MDILSVCGDTGGTNGLLPVVRALREKGREVALVTTGDPAIQVLEAEGESFQDIRDVDELRVRYPVPSLLLLSMCSGWGVFPKIIPAFAGVCSRVILQDDIWGGNIWTVWRDAQHRPDYVCVNDLFAQEHIVTRAWPGFPVQNIKITGFPALDKYAAYDCVQIERKVRSALLLSEDWPIVLFAGTLKGTTQALQEVVSVLNQAQATYFVPRQHPRMVREAPEELEPWRAALSNFRGPGAMLEETSSILTSSLIAAASIVLATASSVHLEATVLRKATIAILYPSIGMPEFLEATRGELNEYPLAALGCCAKAQDRDELRDLLIRGLRGSLALEENQRKNFLLDGRNAERVAEAIQALI